MAFTVELGDVYLISIPTNELKHLFVVVTCVDSYTGQFVIVPIDTYKMKNDDPTVKIQPGPGCPDFIKKQSFVNYALARLVNPDWLESFIIKKQAIPMDKFSQKHQDDIVAGLKKTRRLRKEVKDFILQTQWPSLS
jgi:hypothetical protein